MEAIAGERRTKQRKWRLSLLLREKGDRSDFELAFANSKCRTVDEELLCVRDTSSVIRYADATFPHWGRLPMWRKLAKLDLCSNGPFEFAWRTRGAGPYKIR